MVSESGERAGTRGEGVAPGPGSTGGQEAAPGAGSTGRVGAPVVAVSYRNERTDLQAAARLAVSVVPAIVRIRRATQLVLALLMVVWPVYILATVGRDDGQADGSGGPSWTVLSMLAVVTVIALVWSSRRFWAYQTARNAVSRRTLGDAAFQADEGGFTTSVVGSSGSYAWSRVDRVADGDEAVVFTIGPQIFTYVPARVLSEADRGALRRLSAGGTTWLDLRTRR